MAAPRGRVYRVTAAAREGFVDRRRAGEAWPRGAGNFREVFVVDGAEDPPGRKLEDGTFAIGQKTLAILKSDPEIFLDSGDRAGPVTCDKCPKHEARIAELEALLAAATDPKGKGSGK